MCAKGRLFDFNVKKKNLPKIPPTALIETYLSLIEKSTSKLRIPVVFNNVKKISPIILTYLSLIGKFPVN